MEANRYRIVWTPEAQRKLREIVAQASSLKRQNNGSTEGLKKNCQQIILSLACGESAVIKIQF